MRARRVFRRTRGTAEPALPCRATQEMITYEGNYFNQTKTYLPCVLSWGHDGPHLCHPSAGRSLWFP